MTAGPPGYWSASEISQVGSVYRAPSSGGGAELVHATPGSVEGIAADSESVFWVMRQSPGESLRGAVFGSGPKALLESNPFSVMGVAIDANAVFFTSIEADGSGSVRKLYRR
ncbi:MAG: hypothetical protein IPI67_39245 [Myxococcales bacterium]|nr:hypothetical protein [Myxococcales bacterium]